MSPSLNYPLLMDILKAYWRMDYIRSEEEEIPRGEVFSALPKMGDDRAALIVHRAAHCYLVLNRYPYNAGHLLAVPYEPWSDLGEMPVEARTELMETIVFAQQLLRRAMQPEGFNIGFNIGKNSGAGIPGHLHAHIVPRWTGDTNFVTVIGKTRVLPQALEQTWECLCKHLND